MTLRILGNLRQVHSHSDHCHPLPVQTKRKHPRDQSKQKPEAGDAVFLTLCAAPHLTHGHENRVTGSPKNRGSAVTTSKLLLPLLIPFLKMMKQSVRGQVPVADTHSRYINL